MNLKFKRNLIAVVTFIPGAYFILEFILPKEIGTFKFGAYHEQILNGLVVLGNMAIGLGLINILFVHGRRLVKLQKSWINSFALLFGLFLMLFIQSKDMYVSLSNVNKWKPISDLELFLNKINSDTTIFTSDKIAKIKLISEFANMKLEQLDYSTTNLNAENAEKLTKLKEELDIQKKSLNKNTEALAEAYKNNKQDQISLRSEESVKALRNITAAAKNIIQIQYENLTIQKVSKLMYQGFFVPLSSSMFSLLAFYIAYAAYRSFRVKSVEAAIMMFSAILVILGQIPQGRLISEKLPAIRAWLMENINTPGNRAIYFGAAVAGLAMALRMWLSLERSPFQDREDT